VRRTPPTIGRIVDQNASSVKEKFIEILEKLCCYTPEHPIKPPLVINKGAKDHMFCNGYRGAMFAVAPSAASPWEGYHIRTFRAGRKLSQLGSIARARFEGPHQVDPKNSADWEIAGQ
jgi:hypothetical protein